MKNNTKTSVKHNFLSELKDKMRKGDRQIVADIVGCHPITLDQALEGKEGLKRDQAIDALINLLNEREEKRKKLENQFKTK